MAGIRTHDTATLHVTPILGTSGLTAEPERGLRQRLGVRAQVVHHGQHGSGESRGQCYDLECNYYVHCY
jgi:hypothetical protein